MPRHEKRRLRRKLILFKVKYLLRLGLSRFRCFKIFPLLDARTAIEMLKLEMLQFSQKKQKTSEKLRKL